MMVILLLPKDMIKIKRNQLECHTIIDNEKRSYE